jgi:nucleoside-diphosphate-sugar epimerase
MSLTGFVPKISLDEGILSVYEWATKPENATKIGKWLS